MVFFSVSTDQDLLSGFMLALYVFSQVSVRDLQILSHLTVIVEEGQVAILDSNQLQQEVKSSDCAFRTGIWTCLELTNERLMVPESLKVEWVAHLLRKQLPIQVWEVDSLSTKIRFKTFS